MRASPKLLSVWATVKRKNAGSKSMHKLPHTDWYKFAAAMRDLRMLECMVAGCATIGKHLQAWDAIGLQPTCLPMFISKTSVFDLTILDFARNTQGMPRQPDCWWHRRKSDAAESVRSTKKNAPVRWASIHPAIVAIHTTTQFTQARWSFW